MWSLCVHSSRTCHDPPTPTPTPKQTKPPTPTHPKTNNPGIKLWESGDLQRHNVRVMGTPIDTIVATEDREIFSDKLREINETLALSYPGACVRAALGVGCVCWLCVCRGEGVGWLVGCVWLCVSGVVESV